MRAHAHKGIYPGRRTERLVKKSAFKSKRGQMPGERTDGLANALVPLAGVLPPLASGVQVVQGHPPPDPEEYVELGDGLWNSLVHGYRFPVDREYLNRLPTETVQRLYVYLSKKDRDSAFYEERIILLGRKLGLAKLAPSHILEVLKPACSVLLTPLAPDGKHFLRSFEFTGERADTILKVETNREEDFDSEQRLAKRLAAFKQRLATKR